ncbi:patatin-like phospholipase family protein [Parasphingorhabdus sp.]|uniref:patatin-like phospholipase family protein n=1 Tax=Parasphingorhabdus sp. TaxID=2709688 RepID=UPI003D273F96
MATNDQLPSEPIALALSGGGSRAMAFHLGCLRALEKEGILSRVSAISSVSGGSVLASLYCSVDGDFDDFEQRTREALAEGFVVPSVKVLFSTTEGLKAVTNAIPLMIDRTLASLARLLFWPLPARLKPQWRWLRESSVVRRYSRTTILRRTFDKMLGGVELAELRTDRPRLIIVACDLLERSAFYFSAKGIGSWRRGVADVTGQRLADAVAASAAYPGFLPALDKTLNFKKGAGKKLPARVVLTDGGVYDNLGLSPLWPDRDSSISLFAEKYSRIVACRAGYGLKLSPAPAFLPSRMGAVLDSIHARAQNATMNRLFDLKNSGKLESFLLPYLDQADERLKFPPTDLVTAAEVANYPTNFSAMSEEWIEKISKRGEQLTIALIKEYGRI